MDPTIAIVGAALLFAVFGLLRRGREPEPERGCQSCDGTCETCPTRSESSPDGKSKHARS